LAADADWPVYRHDTRLTGASAAHGRIRRPAILAEYDLGDAESPYVTLKDDAAPSLADLDGDGQRESFTVIKKKLIIRDAAGHERWSYQMTDPGDGSPRAVRLFPSRKDRQLLVFTSRMDTGEGQGYCFAFDRGLDAGRLLWTTGSLTGQHGPTMVVDDVDGDSQPDIVVAPHYRVQIFNGQTGQLKSDVPWEVGRNYGALLTRPATTGHAKDIYVISDFVAHVDAFRLVDGKWLHAWGHKYLEPNVPLPQGRETYLRVGPHPIEDLNGDGRDEMAYMLSDASIDESWHLHIRDAATGEMKADLRGIWLWGIANLDADSSRELIYTPTDLSRPAAGSDVHIAKFDGHSLRDLAVLPKCQPLLHQAVPAENFHSIADQGLIEPLVTKLSAADRPSLFVAGRDPAGTFVDRFRAFALNTNSVGVHESWTFGREGHRLNLTDVHDDKITIRDFSDCQLLGVDANGHVVRQDKLPKSGGFQTLPIVVDLDGDQRNEIVVQNAAQQIVALETSQENQSTMHERWRAPGVAMNSSPGYLWNGGLCPQSADLNGDGRPEVVCAAQDAHGLSSLVALQASGQPLWSRSIERCPWGDLQAGVNLWTFGRFAHRPAGQDVYVDIHRRSKGSSEGWVLCGDTGDVIWRQQGIAGGNTAMPFGGGLPAATDVNNDGVDDLVQLFYVIYAAISGDTGKPIFPPALVTDAAHFNKWVAYAWPTIADLDGDGRPDTYLNSPSYARGAYAAVKADGQPLWAEFHDNAEGSDGFGPVADLDDDGKLEVVVPVLNGTLVCLEGASGKRKWKINAPVAGDVIAVDVDGEPGMELLFAGHDVKLHAASGRNGAELWSLAAGGWPIAADVTGDGLVEILAVGSDGVLRIIGDESQAASGKP
jgi:outer membrane protein assembly factor BamB